MSSFNRENLAVVGVFALLALSLAVRKARMPGESSRWRGTTYSSALDAPIPRDPYLRKGTLQNGLHYFVRPNRSPAQRAELRLVVNAGSVLESENQRGLAHAIEHMVFRGTTHFPGEAITQYLQSIGMRDGVDVNATTGQDETIYRIRVPTDRRSVLDTAIRVLAEMASAATFDSAEAQKEAGIVFEEWRERNRADERLHEATRATLLAGSPYATRKVIGDTSVLRRFDTREMLRFYHDWYRPELMALVAVGDFDGAAVERLVKKHFGTLPTSREPRTRPTVTMPTRRATEALLLSDPEATGTEVSVWMPRAPRARLRVSDFRDELVSNLWHAVLNARLEGASDEPGSPLLDANLNHWSVARPLSAELANADAVDGDAMRALGALVGETARLAQHGPTARELSRERDAMLRASRESAQWNDWSGSLARQYVDEFLTGRCALTDEAQYALMRDLLPAITVDDIRTMARTVSADSDALVVVTAPDDRHRAAVTPSALIAQVHAAARRAMTPLVEERDSTTFDVQTAAPGKIVSETSILGAQAVDWKLSNGMRVILMPTQHTNNELSFRLIGNGGSSLASDAEYPSAHVADDVIRNTGLGTYSAQELSGILDASSIELSQVVTDDAIAFDGSAAPEDLGTLFKLLHLQFSAPRNDEVAFRRYLDRAIAYEKHRAADPDNVFDDTLAVTVAQHHPRAIRAGTTFLRQVSFASASAFWQARMANASGFTFVMVGDFSIELVRPLITQYLASLPSGTPEQPRDAGVRFPAGIVRRDLHMGDGQRAKTELVLSGVYDGSAEASDLLGMVKDVADLALNNALRETLGGTYGVHVSRRTSFVHPWTYQVRIAFEASPANIDSLSKVALGEVERLRTSGPTKSEFEKTRAAKVRDFDWSTFSNDFWSLELTRHARMGWSLDSIATHQKQAEHLSIETVRRACATFLGTTQLAQVTMYPRSTPVGRPAAPTRVTAQPTHP